MWKRDGDKFLKIKSPDLKGYFTLILRNGSMKVLGSTNVCYRKEVGVLGQRSGRGSLRRENWKEWFILDKGNTLVNHLNGVHLFDITTYSINH